jgi:hypothetical protein
MTEKQFKLGDPVMCNGYPGTISRICEGQLAGMVEVRFPRGTVCVSVDDAGLYPRHAFERHPQRREAICKHCGRGRSAHVLS